MKQFSKAMLVGLVSVAFLGQAAAVMADSHERKRPEHRKERDHRDRNGKDRHKKRRWCDRHARVKIRDLDAKPRVFWHGTKIKEWYVYAWYDGKRHCYANISIWDKNDRVARERNYRLEPGRNKIELKPEDRYRFSRKDHCFDVYFNLKGNRRKIDADRQFCAREKRAWTLDERRGHRKGKRHHKGR